MPISHQRRYYLTLPDRQHKEYLVEQAEAAGMSVSNYIVNRLALLEAIENTVIGAWILSAAQRKIGDSGSAQ